MENYTIYKFTFSDGKTYVGQTKGKAENRWQNGEGYKEQPVYVPIILEGWNNIKKEILHTNLTKEQADHLEKYYIKKFNSIKNGYNQREGGNNNTIKNIKIEIEEKNFYTFLKDNLYRIKPNAVKLLLYFFFNNYEEINFSPAKIDKIIGISENTCRASLKELINIGIITLQKENKYILKI